MSDSGSIAAESGVHKAICTICFEDLKPINEDLQTIPICGHVFHELCIQQWIEYCPSKKKPTCPVCKQTFSRNNLTRLYFQSAEDSTQIFAQCSTTGSTGDDVQSLVEEVKRMEMKLAAMTAKFENQKAQLDKVAEELSAWKQLAKREEHLKEDFKKEKEYKDHLFHMKVEELSLKTMECSKLRDRSLSLAKELAALKLATDLNLDEEDMVKLASIGHGSNTENALDILRKTLALRNKSYKDLMVQCNTLGRSETRASNKLQKAKEKMIKLKMRLQELEKAFEIKENEVLRDLKASNKFKPKLYKDLDLPYSETERTELQNISSPVAYKECSNHASDLNIESLKMTPDYKGYPTVARLMSPSIQQSASYCKVEDDLKGSKEGPPIIIKRKMTHNTNTSPSENLNEVQLESVACASSIAGSLGFEAVSKGGAGRWCRQNQPLSSAGDLIAVGADGRGGRIKILKPQNCLEESMAVAGSKRQKQGVKPKSQFIIEHFFEKKANQ